MWLLCNDMVRIWVVCTFTMIYIYIYINERCECEKNICDNNIFWILSLSFPKTFLVSS